MKIIFMGTPDFAVPTLCALKEEGYEIAVVVTQPDKPAGRNKKLKPSDVKVKALELGLNVSQPIKANDPDFIDMLKAEAPDFIVVVAYGQILNEEILSLPKYGCINVHASLLPKYRGSSPIQWAIINGDKTTGVTTMLMDKGLDTGDILLKEEIAIDDTDTAGTLFDKLSITGAELLIKTLSAIKDGSITPIPQYEKEAVYVRMLKKNDGLLDFNLSADKLEHLIRGLSPWPGTFAYLNDKKLGIKKADISDNNSSSDTPGRVTNIKKDSFDIECKSGLLRVSSVLPEGKKQMSVSDFLNGNKLEEGTILGKRS